MNYSKNIKSYRRHGLASFFAVAALGVVATAVLALTTMLRIDHRRTESTAVDAQLRQLLLAGAASVEVNHDPEVGSDEWVTGVLPETLTASGAAIRWKRVSASGEDDDQISVFVQAEYAGASAHQVLRFTPNADHQGWTINAADLHP